MNDEIPTQPSPLPVISDPNAPGKTTSEYKLTKWVAIIGALIVALAPAFAGLQTKMPDVAWFAVAATILGVLATVWGVVSKYVGGRADVKVGQLKVEAAQVHVDALAAATKIANP